VSTVLTRPQRLVGALRKPREPSLVDEAVVDDALRSFLYDAAAADGPVSLDDVAVEGLGEEQLLWIDVSSDQHVDAAAAVLGLTAETVDKLREPSSEPALFAYEGYVHVVVIASGHGDPYAPHALHCVVGSNWVLTGHRGQLAFLDRFDERIRGDSGLGRIDGPGFLAAILHEHVASYLAELRPIESDLDRLDVSSMSGRAHEDTLLRELVRTRIRIAKLRRLLEPHRELFSVLARSEFAILSGSHAPADFAELTELLERTLRSMDATREMIGGSFEIFTTWTAHATNRVMKRLTVASLTLLPPTLLAGVMGMNSLPGALASPAAFWATTIAMIGLAAVVLSVAWRRGWV
jgi:magnesium transporter